MIQLNTFKALQTAGIALILSVAAVPASAQVSGGGVGAVIGGSAGAIVGGSVDKRGSNKDGVLIGAAVGGTLGYLIGSQLDDRDRVLSRRYSNQRGEYYRHNGQSYRRYYDRDHGYVSIKIGSADPYFYQDGRSRNSQYRKNRTTGKSYKKRR